MSPLNNKRPDHKLFSATYILCSKKFCNKKRESSSLDPNNFVNFVENILSYFLRKKLCMFCSLEWGTLLSEIKIKRVVKNSFFYIASWKNKTRHHSLPPSLFLFLSLSVNDSQRSAILMSKTLALSLT